MHLFKVWAPQAQSVSVEVNAQLHDLRPHKEHGWWFAEVENAFPGNDYTYSIDDDPTPLPDPRSQWQPYGVHGSSRLLNHNSFEWADERWSPPSWHSAVIYELHVGTFTPAGTFAAAIERLDYLHDLGVTHIELMPINAFPGRWGWGYDGVGLYAPHNEYGSPDDLKRFVDHAHAAGLAVVLDVVYNHFGPEGNYTGRFGNYITNSHHTPWGGAVNFDDTGCAEVRRFFLDNAVMWLCDYHFDGLRLDAVHSYVDHSDKHFLKQLSEEVSALTMQSGRSHVLIAESDLNDPRIITPRAENGYGIDAQWSDDFHHALFALLTGELTTYYADFGSMDQLVKSIKLAFVYDGIYSSFRGGVHGQPAPGLGGERFLGYIQNHDQVGNRALGERIHAVAGTKKARLAAALVLTAPFIPMIFQGEEFAADSPFLYFADHTDPELKQAVTTGRRREHAHDVDTRIVPDPESEQTFMHSKLDWHELRQPEHQAMLQWYRSLIQLRSAHPCLQDGRRDLVRIRYDSATGWLAMHRGVITLLFSFSKEVVTVPLEHKSQPLLISDDTVAITDGEAELPPWSFAAVLATTP